MSFHVKRGEVVALLGRNGAGKSSTMKSLMGMLHKKVQMTFMGRDISNLRTHEMAALGVALVPEDRRIFTDLSVAENLEVARQAPRQDLDGKGWAAWQREDVFELFPNLKLMSERMGSQMSGGEQQLLSVGRALMGNPYLMLLDEPTQGVAPLMVEQLMRLIMTLKGRGISILLSEQNHDFVKKLADRIYLIEQGQIRREISAQDIAELPQGLWAHGQSVGPSSRGDEGESGAHECV
jgi:branched-chain amino acid transport system ATP-binding protein